MRHPSFLVRCTLPLALSLALGCDESQTLPPTPPTVPGNLAGAVYQQLVPDQGIAGASVSWNGESVQTDAEGEYLIEPLEAAAGSLRVSHGDYSGQSRWVAVGAQDLRESFALLPLDQDPPEPAGSFAGISSQGSSIRLSWSPPSPRGEFAGYLLEKSPGEPQSQLFDSLATGWLDIHVTPSRSYTYRLMTRDLVGNLSDALEIVARVDLLPTGLALQISSDSDFGSIPMSWAVSPDDDFARNRIFRADSNADSTDLEVFSSTDPEENTFVDTDVDANRLYSYRLYTYDTSGQVSDSGSYLGAAQKFLEFLAGEKSLLALPGGNRFLVSRVQFQQILLADGEGQEIETLQLSPTVFAPRRLALIEGGARAWGADRLGKMLLIGTDPLVQERSFVSGIDAYDLAYLGGDRMLLTRFGAGAPQIVDLAGEAVVDDLPGLETMEGNGLVAADSTTSIAFVATAGGEWALYRFDLSGQPALLEQAALPARPIELALIPGVGLLIGYQQSGLLQRYDPADLSVVHTVDTGSEARNGSFSMDGGQWWQSRFDSNFVDGFTVDFDLGTSVSIGSFDQILSPTAVIPVADGSAIVTSLSALSPLISICDPSQPPSRSGNE